MLAEVLKVIAPEIPDPVLLHLTPISVAVEKAVHGSAVGATETFAKGLGAYATGASERPSPAPTPVARANATRSR